MILYVNFTDLLSRRRKRYLRLRWPWRSQLSWNYFILVVYQMLNKDKWSRALSNGTQRY